MISIVQMKDNKIQEYIEHVLEKLNSIERIDIRKYQYHEPKYNKTEHDIPFAKISNLNQGIPSVKISTKGFIEILPLSKDKSSNLGLNFEFAIPSLAKFAPGIKINSGINWNNTNALPNVNDLKITVGNKTQNIQAVVNRTNIENIKGSFDNFSLSVGNILHTDKRKLKANVYMFAVSCNLKYEQISNILKTLKVEVDLNKLFRTVFASKKIDLSSSIDYVQVTFIFDFQKKTVTFEIRVTNTITICINLKLEYWTKFFDKYNNNNRLWESIKEIFLLIFGEIKETTKIEITQDIRDINITKSKDASNKEYKYISI